MHHHSVFASHLKPSSATIACRELIREYMSRTRHHPPAIFETPAFAAFDATPKDLVDMAYKHPHVLQDEIETTATSTTGSTDEDCGIYSATNGDIKYNEFSSIELIGADEDADFNRHCHENGFKSINKTTAFSSINDHIDGEEMGGGAGTDNCKLIGKPNPHLIKTWEKLNRKRSKEFDQSLKADRDFLVEAKPKIAPRRKYFTSSTTHSLAGKRPPNESDSSEHFYDSIDNESVFTQNDDDDDANGGALITSMCNDEIVAGGEGMAEPPLSFTIDNKSKLCWSTDSDKIDFSP